MKFWVINLQNWKAVQNYVAWEIVFVSVDSLYLFDNEMGLFEMISKFSEIP